MSITGLDSPDDVLLRLKEATGELARVERPDVAQTPEALALQEFSINPMLTSSEGKSLESSDNSRHDSIESLIKQSDALDLAMKVMRLQPIEPREALNKLREKKRAIQENLRQEYLGNARRGTSECFRTQSSRESWKSNFWHPHRLTPSLQWRC